MEKNSNQIKTDLGSLVTQVQFSVKQCLLIGVLLLMFCGLYHIAQAKSQSGLSLAYPIAFDIISLLTVLASFWLIGKTGLSVYENGVIAKSPLGTNSLLWKDVEQIRLEEYTAGIRGIKQNYYRLILRTKTGQGATLSSGLAIGEGLIQEVIKRVSPKIINQGFEKIATGALLDLGKLKLSSTHIIKKNILGGKKIPLEKIRDLRLDKGYYCFLNDKNKILIKVRKSSVVNYCTLEEFFKQFLIEKRGS
jgi:hypothetical protein